MKKEEEKYVILSYLGINIETDTLNQLINTLKNADDSVKKYLDKIIVNEIKMGKYCSEDLVKSILTPVYEPKQSKINMAIDNSLSKLIKKDLPSIDNYQDLLSKFPEKVSNCQKSNTLLVNKKIKLLGNIFDLDILCEIFQTEYDQTARSQICFKLISGLNELADFSKKIALLSKYGKREKLYNLIFDIINQPCFNNSEFKELVEYYGKTEDIKIGKIIYEFFSYQRTVSLDQLFIIDRVYLRLSNNDSNAVKYRNYYLYLQQSIEDRLELELNSNRSLETYVRYLSALNNSNSKIKKYLKDKIIFLLNNILSSPTSIDELLSLAAQVKNFKQAEMLIINEMKKALEIYYRQEMTMKDLVDSLTNFLTLSYSKYLISPEARNIINEAGEAKMINYGLIDVCVYLNDYGKSEKIWYILEKTANKLLSDEYDLKTLFESYAFIHYGSKQYNEKVEQKIYNIIVRKIKNISNKLTADRTQFIIFLKNGVPENFKKICVEKAIKLL